MIAAGEVVEQGKHDELVAQGGLYARLARQQSLDGSPVDLPLDLLPDETGA